MSEAELYFVLGLLIGWFLAESSKDKTRPRP